MNSIGLDPNQSIRKIAETKFPNIEVESSRVRKQQFIDFLTRIFPTDIPVNYRMDEVRGDGNCFLRSILRYFGYLTISDIPNKDLKDFSPDEREHFDLTLNQLREMVTEYIRNSKPSLRNFELDPNTPDCDPICKFLASSMDLRLIVIDYDPYKPGNNFVTLYEPTNPSNISDTVILLNLSHHFNLIFPTATSSLVDTKQSRKIAGDKMIELAGSNGLLVSIDL
jgi:hypothetical protein